MADFNQQFFYAILIIALGFTLKHFKILKEEDGEGISRVIFNVTLPSLIIVSLDDIVIEPALISLIFVSFFYGLFITGVGLFVFRNEENKLRGMLGMLVAGFNIGLFAYPLVEGIWGRKGIQYFGMFDVGNAFIVFGVIYLVGSHYASDQQNMNWRNSFRKLSRSIPLLTYIIVSLLAILNIPIPTFILNPAGIISAANMPLSFLLLGIYLSFSIDRTSIQQMIKVVLVRYVTGLVVGTLLFFLLPFDEMFKYTVLLGLILPISVSVLPYSVEFDYNRRFVGTVSNITIIISFFLLWVLANLLIA